MARNVNLPVQVLQGSHDKLAETVLKQGEIAYDVTAKKLTVGDGTTAGGVPHVTEAEFDAGMEAMAQGLSAVSGAVVDGLAKKMDENPNTIYLDASALDPNTTASATVAANLAAKDKNGNTCMLFQTAQFAGTNVIQSGMASICKLEDGSHYQTQVNVKSSANVNRTTVSTYNVDSDGKTLKAVEEDIATQQWADGKFLPLAGGTMTGDLYFADHSIIDQLDGVDGYNAPDTNIYKRLHIVTDRGASQYGFLEFQFLNNGTRNMCLGVPVFNDGNWDYSVLYVGADSNGIKYVRIPTPDLNSAGNQAITAQWANNKYPLKVSSLNIYVGGSNASDTADIGNGRGLSADKPFATIQAALNYIKATFVYVGGYPPIYVHLMEDNLILPSGVWLGNLHVQIRDGLTDGSVRTLFTNSTEFSSGVLSFYGNFKLKALSDDARYIVRSTAYNAAGSTLYFAGSSLELEGTVSNGAIAAQNCGRVFLHSNAISGNITGRRYHITYGGQILTNGRGANLIPGSIEGYSDASGLYF